MCLAGNFRVWKKNVFDDGREESACWPRFNCLVFHLGRYLFVTALFVTGAPPGIRRSCHHKHKTCGTLFAKGR